MKYWYIVWKEEFTSYGIKQGNGYYVKWKNKCEDEFSKIPAEAKKYKSLGSAISMLGLNTLENKINSIDKFYELNEIDHKSINRNNSLNTLLDINEKEQIIFKKGRIERYYENGKIELANNDAIDHVNSVIQKNLKKIESHSKRYPHITEKTKTIVEVDTNENFWDGF